VKSSELSKNLMNSKESNKLESPEVVVVEASAGSGKTYCLAKRYVQLLINPKFALHQIPLRNILAITFTNKATIEMKERILELLKKIALDAFSSSEEEQDILSLLGVDKKYAQDKATLIMDELIRHYNFFCVSTIDSFINALLVGSALNIDRSASFKIKRDYSTYLAYCLDRVIDSASRDSEIHTFLREFLEHYLFVENRTSWFPKRDILDLIQSFFTLSNKYGADFKTHPRSSREVIKKKAELFGAIKELVSILPPNFNGTAKNSILRFLDSQDKSFNLKRLPDRFKYQEVPMSKGAQAPRELVKRWRRIHQGIKELAQLDATCAYNPYVRLASKLFEYFDAFTKHEDILFLEELNHKARSLFINGVTVAEIYYRLATRFIHYLIDEFQDTSVLQWRNLEAMIQDALACGGTLFYVGDKKQAIYRFRGGESQLFDKVREEFSHYNPKLQVLKRNWRSQKAIVEFNNKIFSPQNLKDALIKMGILIHIGEDSQAIKQILDVFDGSHQEYESQNTYGYVYIERIEESNQEERNQLVKDKLLPLLQDLAQRFSYKDIAILCRDNNEVETVTSWLLENRIPVESEKTLSCLENPLIKEIISFLKFLHSPINDLEFATFILGEIFGKVCGLSYQERTDFLFELYMAKERIPDVSLYRQFRKHYPEIWRVYIEEFFKSVGFISPYELLVSIYSRFKVMENFRDEQAFFAKFLDLAKLQEEEYVGLAEFLAYLEHAPREDLYVTVARTDSVHILTIHKSKGLEFGVVIIPFLRMDIIPETTGKGSSLYLTSHQDQSLRLVRITKEHLKYSPQLGQIYKEAYVKACIDELNNMYVALTRAKFELYIFIPRKSGAGPNNARYLIPPDLQQLGQPRIYPREPQRQRPIIEIPTCDYRDWVNFLKGEFADKSTIINREKILQGNVIHYILSFIGNLYQQPREVIIKEALNNAKIKYPFISDFSLFEKKINQLLDKEDLVPFFYLTDAQILKELEVADASGEVRRIDRLIVKKDEVYVIDYKSSPGYEAEYKKQVAQYTQIIGQLYPGRRIKGFIIYLDKLEVEEVV
jgi:ATP-dependent exoDNAse (exonuclease V) beta subunit